MWYCSRILQYLVELVRGGEIVAPVAKSARGSLKRNVEVRVTEKKAGDCRRT